MALFFPLLDLCMTYSLQFSPIIRRSLLPLLLVGLHTAPAALAQTSPAKPAPAFVTINGEAQSQDRARILLVEQLRRGAPNTPQLQNSVREALIAQTLMAQEAVKAGLDKQPLVRAQVDLSRQSVLAQAWQDKIIEDRPITDKDLETEYQRQVTLLGTSEVRLRHLLVAEEATATLLLEKIQTGSKIADLAAQYTRDDATRQTGGLTGWIPVGQLSPALAEASKDLAPGKVSPKVVKGQAGWHVLQLEERRAYTPPTLEDSKPQLADAVRVQRIQEQLTRLRQSAKVE
jgi:peptidyl-prolyl cis-trans isomerase C